MNVPAMILAVTISLLILLVHDRPIPSRLVQTDYCVISRRVAVRNPVTGEWMFGYGQGYGPCSEQDIYRVI